MIVGLDTYDDSEHYRDLNYCENDANDWGDQLSNTPGLKFDRVEKYFDNENDPGCDGQATEHNVKQALNNMINSIDNGDIVVFIFSGHSYNKSGNYGLCMWDCEMGQQGEDGILNATEILSIFNASTAEKMFLFFDSCHSFGIRNTLDDLSNKDTLFFSAAADWDEIAYEDKDNYNGCWTRCFLEESWQIFYNGDINEDFENIFFKGLDKYYDHTGDPDYETDKQKPKRWNHYRDVHGIFCLSKYGITPP